MKRDPPNNVVPIESHPRFERADVAVARGRLRRLVCDLPEPVVLRMLAEAERCQAAAAAQ